MFGLLKRNAQAKGRIGVCIDRQAIAVAVVTRESDHPLLKRCDRLDLDAADGPEAIGARLRAAGLPRLPVSIVLRPEDYQLVLVEAPDVVPAELRAAMRWRLKDSIDFRIEEAVIDVFEVPTQNRAAHGRMMYAVAARRDSVERSAAALAGFPEFDVVDVPELCLRNIAASLPDSASGVALLHLGATSASVILVRGTTFYFSRQMELLAGRGGGGRDADLNAEAIILELQRSLDYYERHFDQPPILRVAISPGGARADALVNVLKRDTSFQVDTIDVNALLRCEAPVAADTQAACLLAVGAALREERRSL